MALNQEFPHLTKGVVTERPSENLPPNCRKDATDQGARAIPIVLRANRTLRVRE
jgi:hypothetical protein